MGSSPIWVRAMTIKLVFAASVVHTALRRKNKDWLAQSEKTCLPADLFQ